MEVDASNEISHRSPLVKLVKHFESARDKWRKRCNDKQKLIRHQKIKIRDLTQSRDNWKDKAIAAQQQLERSKKKLQ